MKAIAVGKPDILTWFETIHQDVRYGLRALRRNPELLLVAALSLGLGIGANLTVFSLIGEILLNPPTAFQPERLVQIEVGRYSQMSYPNYRDLQQSRVFEGLAAYTSSEESWIQADKTETVRSHLVSANFFEVLGVQAALGRTFTSEEARPERNPQLAVLSFRFYQSRLNADPNIIGRSINVNGKQFTVLGVLPANYRSLADFGEAPFLYFPISSLFVNKWIATTSGSWLWRGSRGMSLVVRPKQRWQWRPGNLRTRTQKKTRVSAEFAEPCPFLGWEGSSATVLKSISSRPSC